MVALIIARVCEIGWRRTTVQNRLLPDLGQCVELTSRDKAIVNRVFFLYFVRYDDLCCQKIELLSSFAQILCESISCLGLKEGELILCCLVLVYDRH